MRAERLLRSDVEAGVRETIQGFVDVCARTEATRRGEHERRAVVEAILEETERLGQFPSSQGIRNRFESTRAVVNQLVHDGCLALWVGDKYVVTVKGLRDFGADGRAERVLRSCDLLLQLVRNAFLAAKTGTARVRVAELAAEPFAVDAHLSTGELGRAASLLVIACGGGAVRSEKFDTDGWPESLLVSESVLDFSLEESGRSSPSEPQAT